jgi:inner membrane protein
MTWWWWVLAGFGLAMMEFVTPGGFVAAFFAAGAIAVGLISAVVPLPAWMQWALFSVVSIASLLGLRGRLRGRLSPSPDAQEMGDLVGGLAIAGEDLAPKAFGKGECRGAQWTLKNVGREALKSGQRCRVEQVDGLTLMVRAEDSTWDL